jgi:8-oxo-dGTP pyrophosphatase MutT (NUDIX family)
MNEENPWKTLGTRVVYDNPWIHVREDSVIQADGNKSIYGVVQFKNIAIGVLPIDDEGYVHLVGQFRYPIDKYSWEIPEGGCPQWEDPLSAAQRELMEESGLSAATWEELGRCHLSNSATDELAIYYLATNLKQGVAEPEGSESLMDKRVPFAQALAMVMTGEINDSLSVLAITNYALRSGIKPEITSLTQSELTQKPLANR